MAGRQVSNGQYDARRDAIIAKTWVELNPSGLKTEDIDSVFLASKGSSATGIYTLVFDAVLLLKDGTACRCFDRAPGLIVPAVSRMEDPDDWGTWTRSDSGEIVVVWPGPETQSPDEGAWTKMTGGTPATRIQGSFTHTSAGGSALMGSSYLSQSFFEFFPDGTFSSERSSSFQVTSGNIASPDVSVAGGSSTPGARGIYEIDGYDMKLTYPDGRIEWMGFAQPAGEEANPAKTQLWLNGTYYYRDE